MEQLGHQKVDGTFDLFLLLGLWSCAYLCKASLFFLVIDHVPELADPSPSKSRAYVFHPLKYKLLPQDTIMGWGDVLGHDERPNITKFRPMLQFHFFNYYDFTIIELQYHDKSNILMVELSLLQEYHDKT